jgi:ssDNA-binding Zn-finger/Zn-ribbon topoisomerase 1
VTSSRVRCCRCQASLDALVAELRTPSCLVVCPRCGARQAVTEGQWRRVVAQLQPELPGVL